MEIGGRQKIIILKLGVVSKKIIITVIKTSSYQVCNVIFIGTLTVLTVNFDKFYIQKIETGHGSKYYFAKKKTSRTRPLKIVLQY